MYLDISLTISLMGIQNYYFCILPCGAFFFGQNQSTSRLGVFKLIYLWVFQHPVLLWISVTDPCLVFPYILLEMSPGIHICDRAGVFGRASLHSLLPACSYVMLASSGQWCVGFYGDIAYIDGLQHGLEALIRQLVWPQLLPDAILGRVEGKKIFCLNRICISTWR